MTRMARSESRKPTWAEVGVQNAGLRTAVRAFTFAHAWGVATALLKREPVSIDEFAVVAKMPRATAFRYRQAWLKTFPGEPTPGHMNRVSGAQAGYDEAIRKYRTYKAASEATESRVLTVGSRLAGA